MQRRPPVPALVLGEGNTALGALRAFGRRGIPCFLAPAATDFVRRSRWHRPWPGSVPSAPDCRLSSMLESSPIERAVLSLAPTRGSSRCRSFRRRSPRGSPRARPPRGARVPGGQGRLCGPAGPARSPAAPHGPPSCRRRAARPGRRPARARVPEACRLPRLPDPLRPQGVPLLPPWTRPNGSRPRRSPRASRSWPRNTCPARPLPTTSSTASSTGRVACAGSLRGSGCACGPGLRQQLRPGERSLEDVAPAVATLEALLPAVGYRGIFSAEFKRTPATASSRSSRSTRGSGSSSTSLRAAASTSATWPITMPSAFPWTPSLVRGGRHLRRPLLRPPRVPRFTVGASSPSPSGHGPGLGRPVTFAWDDPLPGLAFIDRLPSPRAGAPRERELPILVRLPGAEYPSWDRFVGRPPGQPLLHGGIPRRPLRSDGRRFRIVAAFRGDDRRWGRLYEVQAASGPP